MTADIIIAYRSERQCSLNSFSSVPIFLRLLLSLNMYSARENSSTNQHDQNTSSLKKNSRKRTRNIEQHKQYQQKVKVQSGLEHITESGKVVPARVFCEQTDCKCKRKCAVKINIARQKAIFETFYGLQNWSTKTLFLRSLMKSRPTKEDLNPVTIKKRTTYIYFLTNDCGIREEVCIDFFFKCIQVSKKSLYHAMKTMKSNEGARDNRGRVSTRKTRERDLNFLRKFIRKFPSYSSHYGPSASEKKIFASQSEYLKDIQRVFHLVRF